MTFRSLLILLLCILPALGAQTPSKLIVNFFGSSTCGECAEIKEAILRPLASGNADKMDLRIHDIDSDSGFALMAKMEKHFGVTQSSPQELYLPDTFLLGYDAIMRDGRPLIERLLADPALWGAPEISGDSPDLKQAIKSKFEGFAFVQILLAGLADGINPCAIATMIFLISFLATQKRKRIEILTVGLSFTAAVFITYLLLGVGAFKVLTLLKQYYWVSKTVKWVAVGAAGIIGLMCFRDAIMFRKTRNVKDIQLQLPKVLKLQIHKVISGNLKGSSLIFGAIAAGFLVTLLEAVCTGQVYLPTIILMTRQEGLKLTGWLYLLFYNFLFVLPLLIIMIMAYFGLRWDQLSKQTQRHMPLLKTILGVVLIGLAVFLGMSV